MLWIPPLRIKYILCPKWLCDGWFNYLPQAGQTEKVYLPKKGKRGRALPWVGEQNWQEVGVGVFKDVQNNLHRLLKLKSRVLWRCIHVYYKTEEKKKYPSTLHKVWPGLTFKEYLLTLKPN